MMVYDSDSTHLFSSESVVNSFIFSHDSHVDRHINIIQYEIKKMCKIDSQSVQPFDQISQSFELLIP